MAHGQEDLRQRTKQFALLVVRLYAALPKTTEAQVLGKQVLRSGTSVGANFHEAYRARSESEYIAKIGDCLKELEETAYWLDLLAEAEIASNDTLAPPKGECNELTAIFVTIVRKMKARTNK